MSKNPTRYMIKIDQSLGFTSRPYVYDEFWTDHVEICHECGTLKFSPIDHRDSRNLNWPKVVKVSLNRAIVFDMEGDDN